MLENLKPIGTIARMWADNMKSKFSDSLLEMFYFTHLKRCKPGEYIHFTKPYCSYHELARNTIVEEIRGDWVFMTDTDHQFAPDLLDRLLFIKEQTGALVLSGIYQKKLPPHEPVAMIYDENDRLCPIFDWERTATVLPVGVVGGGCLLIDRKVLDLIQSNGDKPFNCIGGLSEDYSFCKRCKDLGIPVYLCPQIESHHLIDTALSVEDYTVPPNLRGRKISKEC